MTIKRQNFRIRYDSQCLLMGLDGITYNGQIGDLSLNGARVSIGEEICHGLHLGEMCGLMWGSDPKSSPTKYTGRIVRIDSGTIGISFNQQEQRHLKNKSLATSFQPSSVPSIISLLLVTHLWNIA